MDLKFLEFEQPIAELEARIDALKIRERRFGAQHQRRDRAFEEQERDADAQHLL
jgi:hypothetical protein